MMDLIRKIDGNHWECSRTDWDRILYLAETAGYVRLGTLQYDFDTGEPDDNWESNDYTSQSGQLVIEKDAKTLARSLNALIMRDSTTKEEREAVLEFAQWLKISDEEKGEEHYPGFEIW